MSSQSTRQIPLAQAPDGVGYKLLELPPEVVELLESESPAVLTLHPSPTAALLRAGQRTYSLRQKNTSNALLLLTPAPAPDSANQGAESSSIPQAGLAAISTLHETIELVAESDGSSAPAEKAKGKWHERFGKGR